MTFTQPPATSLADSKNIMQKQFFIRDNYLEPGSVRVSFQRIGTIKGIGKNLYSVQINSEDREMTFEEDVALALKKIGFKVFTYGSGNGITVSRQGLRATKIQKMIDNLSAAA